MNKAIVPFVLAAMAALPLVCQAQSAEEPAKVTVRAVGPLAPVAPAWQPDRTYKYGDLVSYDGNAFKAKTGSGHHRPDPATEVGWEKLNACDDKSKGAVKCEIANQVDTVSSNEEKGRKRDEDVRRIEFNSRDY